MRGVTRHLATVASHKSQRDSTASQEIDILRGLQRRLELTTRFMIIEAPPAELEPRIL